MSDAAWIGIATIVATFFGPVAAVAITRWIDHRRERYQRQLDVFRILMKARRMPTSQEYVGALNLIEVEFFNCDQIMNSWRNLFDHFGASPPNGEDEYKRFMENREILKAKLLSSIAKELRFTVPELEIFRGGYLPQGWVDNDTEGQLARRFLVEIAQGRRTLPISVHNEPQPVTGRPNVRTEAG